MQVRLSYRVTVIREFPEGEVPSFDEIGSETDAVVGEAINGIVQELDELDSGTSCEASFVRKSIKESSNGKTSRVGREVREKDPLVVHPVTGHEMLRSKVIQDLIDDGVRPSRIVKILRTCDIPISQSYVFRMYETTSQESVLDREDLPSMIDVEDSTESVTSDEMSQTRKRGPNGQFLKKELSTV